MRNLLQSINILFFALLCLGVNAQNTPLSTPATQNPDGTTDTPGIPAACAAGFSIYSIDHEDSKIGFLPGGFCVSTDQVNNGTTSITITGTPNGAGIGDVDNIVVDGGRINYSSTDGGDLDATYNFCSTVTNPYVFIGDLETFTTINFFDCSGNPVNVNLMNGQNRFGVSGNSALITGTTSTNQDGYVQVPGSYDCLVININNPPPFTLDVIQIAVGVCMPDPPTGNMTCPYDLYMWKKDDYCVPVYRDADGVFYEKDQNNNNIASLGDEFFTNAPLCGTVEFLEANAIDDNACEPEFTCDAFPVEIEFYEPAGDGCLYSTYWYDQTSFPINDPDPGNEWSAIFSGTDAFGLPAHPGTPTNAAENCGLEWLGDNEGDIDFDDEAGGANEDEQLQLDGWLYVANQLECIQFRIGSSATDHSVALYLGADLNSMELVTEETDDQAGNGNNTAGVVGSFCLPDNAVTTVDDCAWKVIRVRIYAHDDDTAYDPAVDWSFNGGLTWDVVEEQWFIAATSATDNTPPVGTGVGGCNPITNCLIDSDEVIVDEQGNVWPAGNCTNAPTNLYEPNVPNGGSCFGDANAEEGDHFALMPYCVRYNDEPSFICTLCEIDIQVAGCACNNQDNMFGDACPQSVTQYAQTMTVNSETNNSYTVTGTGIVGAITTEDGVGEEQTFSFFVTPGTPYIITVVGDDTGVTQIFEGECEAPNDCNCPSATEICGDGLDNDCDGLVDGADPDVAGDCVLACTPDPVIIDGKDLCLDGYLTHQVWSRECGNTGCCGSSINPHSCALTAFPCVDVNGLPAHYNQCNALPMDPCNPAPPGPAGQAGCTGNDVFTLFGSTHNQAPQFYSTRPEQTQLDGWLVVPPGITCFELKVNHPRAWDAQAVYMGAGVASMSLIGATSYPPLYSTDNEASCQADDGSNPTGDVFNFDVTTDGSTPIVVDGCTWYVVRVRAYIFDESWYHVTPVQWNFGDGFQTIPRKYFQSVGPDGWDTDNNMPTAANVIDAAPFCAYQDADGDLFDAQGDLIALDEFSCQQLGTSTCLDCPPFYNEELCPDNVCVNIPETDANGDVVPTQPVCNLFLYEITPQVIDEMASPGTGLLTRYWDHDQANCTSSQLENESIFCAFSATNGATGTCVENSSGDDGCPTCLPSHPNFDNPTEADLITPTLGNTMHNQTANDADDDDFVLGAYNRSSGENVQQDGWLLVPPDVTCIGFRIYSLSWASGALYLGSGINDMTFVGEWINRSGNNTQDIFYFDIPTSAPTVPCVDCDNQDFRMLRVRTYTHDNNMFANTIWDWNVNGVWDQVPTAHLFPVPDHCSDLLPTDICPTYTTGTPYIAIHEDSNGDGSVDASDRWFDSPWNTCDEATAAIDPLNLPALTPIGLGACDMVSDLNCPLCCDLVVDCSNIFDQQLTCRADLPPVDFDLPIVVDSCGTITPSALTIIPGDSGCPDDTLFITRTYFLQDSEGNMAQCMQTFTVISTMDPTFTSFPADTSVLCGAATDPAATGMAEGAGECDPVSPQAIITFNDVITPGACPQEMTITRTWTVTDRCDRSVNQDQIIMVVDTIPPTMICQAVTIQLDDMGMATLSADQVNNGSSDNCGGSVSLSLSMTDFTCDNIGDNTVTLTGVDECGNMATCEATITVEDNVAPIAICQDVTLSLDANGNASIAAGAGATSTSYSLGGTVSQLTSDVIATACGPSSSAGAICDCPAGYVATGIEGIEATDFGGLVGEFNIICRQLMSNGSLGASTQVTCTNGSSNTTNVLGPVETTGDNVLVAAQSRIGCAIDRVTVFANSMSDVIAGASNVTAAEEGAIFGSNGGTGGGLQPRRSAPNGSVLVGMQTFTSNSTNGYSGGVAWRYAPIEENVIQLGSGFIINNGSNDNCTADDDLELGVTRSEFDCSDIPLGQASVVIEVTMTVTDEQGNSSMCTANVTIMDDTPPIVECPNDIGVQLEAGECEEIVFFDIPFTDNCGSIDAEASQAINEALVSTALDCTNNTSNHLRYFENISPVPVEITQVNFGIFNAGTTETVTVNVYSIAPGAIFQYANMTLQGTVDHDVPAGMNNSILTAMVEATIPVGMNYVLELKANNTTNFIIGYNTSGETESTYIAGNPPVPCVSLEPTDIDGIGFPTFAVILFSNAEGGPTIEQTEGLPSGSYFPQGTTTNTFVVTDVNGNSTVCTFDVNMVEFSNGVTGVMTCNNSINVSLDMNCEVILGADMLLEGGFYGCYDDYGIAVSGGVVGNVITEPGTYTVTITDPDTGNSCWSTINVEDKRAPIFEDCACPVGGSPVMTPFIGTLDGSDPVFTRPFVNGAGVCAPSGAGVNVPYDTYNFALDMDATLGAETVTFTAPSGDSFLALYENSFDPTDPCGNLLITNDDGGAGLLSQFTIMLSTGVEYILVVTTFNNNGNDFGDYVVEITSDATLLELAEECNFRCVDIEYIMGSDDLTPNPSVIACSAYETFFTDELTVDANGNQIILRTWLATNANGSANCVQQFNIAPLDIADLTLPISPVILSCNDGTSPEDIVAIFDNPLTTDNPNTSYVENNEGYVYAYPTYLIDGHPQKVDNNVCDIYAAYTDQELEACEEGCNGNRKVIRTWTLVDWSTLEISTYIQTIKAVDTEAPTLITKDVTVSTDAWGCEASFPAPLPWELHDNCDSYPEYEISGPAGVIIDGNFEDGYFISNVPKGTHTFNYIAYDCCGNQASYSFTVTVVDNTPPVVVAKQNVVISVTSGSTSGAGLAKLYAESIDNGSYDGCSNEVKLEVRRDEDNCDVRGNATYNADGHPQDGSPNPNSPSYDPDGGEYVKFCCADIDNATVDVNGDGELDAGYVKVWLRVWDDGDMNGIYGSEGDNYNEAWAFVKVEDKLAPAITCPPDVTLTCDMDYTDLNMTGSASAYGSCGAAEVEYNDIIINLNTCNEGFVRRRWNVVGRSDIFCDQTITMEDLDAPVNVSFSQVGDFTAANCPDMIALGEPTWVAGPCDVIGYTMDPDTFFFEDGACYKLVLHWTVINWCDYEPNNPFWNGEGIWEHTQIIKVTDETVPVIEDCEDKMFAINDHSDSDDDGEVCEAKITLTNVATDPGSENCPTGWLKWQVFVDLWGDGTDDLEYSSFLPPFDTQFNDTNGNGIPDVYLAPTANGETVSVPLPDIAGSMSNHKVRWKVTDGCNNVTTCDSEFMVVDKKAPTPYMVSLSSAIMESSCTVELWAIDFNIGSFDNCTAQENLRYTFSTTLPEDDPNYDAAQHSSSMVFDGDDVLNSPVEIQVYVWDEKGNADFAEVFLTLVDNHGCVDPVDDSCQPSENTGMAVATCYAADGAGDVGVIYDIRNVEDAPAGLDWGSSITAIHPPSWTRDNIGQVFGLAIDGSENIYLGATGLYFDENYSNENPGQIYIASGANYNAEPFVNLPNTGGTLNGIGNIAYDCYNNQLFASNLENGQIYRISLNGNIMETFDPFAADNNEPGIAPQGEQIWGLNVNEENGTVKVYFARLSDDERSVYSVALNGNGSFDGTEQIEIENVGGTMDRVTDIAFDDDGDEMILAERAAFILSDAHKSRTMVYTLSSGGWSYSRDIAVGAMVSSTVNAGENSAGGVDFGYYGDAQGLDVESNGMIWATGNFIINSLGQTHYGLEGVEYPGNDASTNSNTDYFVDFDGIYSNSVASQKNQIGDVEIFRCGCGAESKGTISGRVTSEMGDALVDAEVKLEASIEDLSQTTMTDSNGEYAFNDLTEGLSYQISVTRGDDYMNGVSTLDLVKIQRHILGLQSLDSPYKLEAADVNADNLIKTSDLLELRRLILGIIVELPSSEPWRFIDASVDLSMGMDLEDVPSVNEIYSLIDNQSNTNFIGVKVGDVTNDAASNLHGGVVSQVRGDKAIRISMMEQEIVSGQEYTVEFTSENFKDVYGYQFTMELSGLEFIGVESGAIDMKSGNLGVLSNGIVTMSYNSSTTMTAGKEEVIYSMNFKATKNGALSDMIEITSKVTASEAYISTSTDNLEVIAVELSTRGLDIAIAESALYQNEPNPFKGQTTIGFDLVDESSATMTVFDVTGKVIIRKTIAGLKGYNTVNLTANELGNTSGVLYYKLESGEFTATKKMIVIE